MGKKNNPTKKAAKLVPVKQLDKLAKEERKLVKHVAETKQAERNLLDAAKSALPKGTFAAGGGVLGNMAGKAIGTFFGGPGGAIVGGKAGSYLGKLLGGGLASVVGFGDYQVESNSIYRAGGVVDEGTQVPQFRNVDYATRIQHREFVTNVYGPTSPEDFALNSWVINPGNADLFPWLSAIAQGYQQYRLRGMIIEYRSMASDYSATGPLGTVAMATNYNALDIDYSSMIRMQNSQYATSSKPSQSHIHAIECSPSETPLDLLYVRNDASYSGVSQDARFYDVAKFQLATEGLNAGAAGLVLGQLWVSYDIEFFKPIMPPEFGRGGTLKGPATKAAPLVGASLTKYGSVIEAPSGATSVLRFKIPGSYFLIARLVATTGAGAASLNSVNPFGGITPLPGQKYDQPDTVYRLPDFKTYNLYSSVVPYLFETIVLVNASENFDIDISAISAMTDDITDIDLSVMAVSRGALVGPDLAMLTDRERMANYRKHQKEMDVTTKLLEFLRSTSVTCQPLRLASDGGAVKLKEYRCDEPIEDCEAGHERLPTPRPAVSLTQLMSKLNSLEEEIIRAQAGEFCMVPK